MSVKEGRCHKRLPLDAEEVKMKVKFISYILALLTVMVCAQSAPNYVVAQIGGSGSIQGTITDPGGAVVPGLQWSQPTSPRGSRRPRQTT